MCEIRTLIGHILSLIPAMLKKSLLFACLFLLSIIPSFSQQVKALVGGTLIDGFGGTPIRNSVIIVEGERIKAIGQAGSLAIPAGAEVISTEGMSVLPGLWDMHVHLMLNGHSDYTHWDSTYIDVFESVIMPSSAHQLLMAGVT
jgi:imidazolonepropionase-like amidohydrolase